MGLHIFVVGWDGGGRCEIWPALGCLGTSSPTTGSRFPLLLLHPGREKNGMVGVGRQQAGGQIAQRGQGTHYQVRAKLHVLSLTDKTENSKSFSVILATGIPLTGNLTRPLPTRSLCQTKLRSLRKKLTPL